MAIKRFFFGIGLFLGKAFIWLLPPPVIRFLARLLFSKSWRRLKNATANPRATQQNNLLKVVRRNQDTEFGKKYDFASIESIEDFQARVPICTYDDLEPYILRMTKGERNVLVSDPAFYFAQTSGTTGRAKFIPVTEPYLEEFRTGRRIWLRQVAQEFPTIIRGTIITMQSPQIEGKTEAGIPYGSITTSIALGRQTLQNLIEPFLKIPTCVFEIQDFNTKYYVLLRLAVATRISLMGTINPSTLMMMCQKLTEFGPDLIRDCENGTLREDIQLAPEMHKPIMKRIKKNPRAAARIRESLEKHGRVRPVDVFPKLCGLLCWKGGNAPFYLRQFPEWFEDLKVMDYGFAASEGNFSIIMSAEGSHGVTSIMGHFFEFIPEDRRQDERPPVLTVDQLEVGKRYFILVTGSHGLYRYDMNDVVEVTGFYRKTPEIVFVHKGGNMISYSGEKIGESHVIQAVSRAQEAAQVEINGFCVTVRLDAENPRYVFAIEPASQTDDQQLISLLAACERNLQEANIEYQAKRKSMRLGEPMLALVQPGAFERWRKVRVEAGAFDAHLKLPHLSQDPSVLERLGVQRYLETETP
jgi:hypothetical protein